MKKGNEKWWISEGIFCAGGWHPLSGRLRNNANCSENEEEFYEWEYSRKRILRLKELGINLIISQFDRGLGDADQKTHQEKARHLAKLCHENNIRHGSYMANTVYFESMLKDYPECEDWVAHTYDNRFVHYGGEQSFRWVACLNSPGWRDRMKRQIEKAVRYAKTDLLHFDNLVVWPEPDSCHCKYCQEKFQQFLYVKYPSEAEQKKRFGFSGLEMFRAPNFYIRFLKPWDFDRFRNPLMQDWIEFRSWTVTDYIKEMSRYARKLNPQIALDSNGQSIWGANQAFIHGVDQTKQASFVDIICEENPDWREDKDIDAVPKSTVKFRGMNLMRKLRKTVFTAFHDEESLAFNLTFAGSPGINTHWGYAEPGKAELKEHQAGIKELLSFYHKHQALYHNVIPMAKIAVWRNFHSLAWVNFDTHLSVCVIEHMLFKRRIPFSIIQDELLTLKALEEYELLILPDVEYISEKQLETIKAFVRRGGRALITEKSGIFNESARKREKWAFADLFENKSEESSKEELKETSNFDPFKQFENNVQNGKTLTSFFGKGRCAYLGEIKYKYPVKTFKSGHNVYYDSIDSRYWKDPYNTDEILDLIEWLKNDFEPVKIYGHPELRYDWVKFHDKSLGCLIMRCGNLPEASDLIFRLKTEKPPLDSSLYLPEKKYPVKLSWRKNSYGFETELKSVKRHAIVKFKIS